MRKGIFISILSALLFASCSNLHFGEGTSVSLYLPALEGSTAARNISRAIEFPAGYDGSVYYYEVNLKQDGNTKFTKTSKGGTTITFTGIHAGDYEIECNACVKKGFDLVVFAQKLEKVTVISGKRTDVDIGLNQVPVIAKPLMPHIFNFNLGNGAQFSVLTASLPGVYNTDYKIDWYIDGKPYNYTCTDYFSFNPEYNTTADNVTIFSLIANNNGSNPGLSFGPHKLYAKITNLNNKSFICTDVVDIYFGDNYLYNITPVSLDIRFKGLPDNTYPFEKNLSLSDFSGTITYKIEYDSNPEFNIQIDYDSFPEDGELNFTANPSNGVLNMTGDFTSGGLQTYTFKISGYEDIQSQVQIKRTYYQELESRYNFGDTEISRYPGQENQDLRCERIFDNLPETPSEYYQWYLCDSSGNIISNVLQEDGDGVYSLASLNDIGTYYFICKITLSGLSDACLNAPGGQVVFYSHVYTVTVGA